MKKITVGGYYKIGEAAKLLGVSIQTLRRWDAAKRLVPMTTPGGTRLYSLDSLKKINPEVGRRHPGAPLSGAIGSSQVDAIASLQHDVKSQTTTTEDLKEILIPTVVSSRPPSRDPFNRFRVKPGMTWHFIPAVLAGVILTLALGTNLYINSYEKRMGGIPMAIGMTMKGVLAETTAASSVEINADTVINGNISAYNLKFATELDQSLTKTSTPTFKNLILSEGKFVLEDKTQTLTNKSMSGSSNTFTNIPNSALTNSKVTVTAGTNLTGGGDVALGSSVTLSLSSNPIFSGSVSAGLLYVNGDATIAGTLYPAVNSTYNLGSSGFHWNTLYVDSLVGVITSNWQRSLGSIAPLNITDDVLIGATSTSSAKIALRGTDTNYTGLTMPYGANLNYVLTTDASGHASWTDPSGAGSFGAWTLTGSTIYPNQSTYNVILGSTNVLDSVAKLVNTGSTLFKPLAVADLPTGGNIGTAANTVDIYTSFNLTQSTTGQTLTLPTPTSAISGRLVYLSNTGSVPFTFLGSTVTAGTTTQAMWNGTAWTLAGSTAGLPVGTIANSTMYWNDTSSQWLENTKLRSYLTGTSPVASIAGTTSFAGLVVDNTVGDLFTASSSGLNRFVITNAGNVGIGTTNPTSTLTFGVASTVGLATSTTALNFQSGLLNLDTTNSRVGIGTTAPTSKLHVEGQCVWEDSLLPIRRKKKKKDSGRGQNDDDDFDYLTLPIKDAQKGDEILSLDELSGEFVYQKIKSKFNMGYKPVFEMILADGRSLITTGEHPFLTKSNFGGSLFTQWAETYEISEGEEIAIAPSGKQNIPFKPAGKPKLGIFVDDSNMFYAQKRVGWRVDLAKLIGQLKEEFEIEFTNYYLAVPEQKDSAFEGTMNFIRQLPKEVTVKTKPLKYIFDRITGKMIKKGDVDLEIALGVMESLEKIDAVMILSGDSDYVDLRRVVVGRGKKIVFAAFKENISWEIKLGRHLILNNLVDLLSLGDKKTPAQGGRLLLSKVYLNNKSLSRYLMAMIYEEQDMFNIVNSYRDGDQMEWMKVISKRDLGEKHVYDLEIENTHNFVANGIVAHNTTGKALVDLNNTGDQNIFVASQSGVTKFSLNGLGTMPVASISATTSYGALVVDNTIGDLFTASSSGLTRFVIANSGFVGIGSAAPTALFDVSSLFTVSTEQITANLPANFTAAGDVAIAYDIVFTNPTISNILSSAPLDIWTGENFNSSDLKLGTYNSGNVVIDSQALLTLYSATISGQLSVGTSSATPNIGNFYLTNSAVFGKSLMMLNQTENAPLFTASQSGVTKFTLSGLGTMPVASISGQTSFATMVVNNDSTVGDLFTASSSGLNRFVITNAGNVGIGTTNPTSTLTFGVASTVGLATSTTALNFQSGLLNLDTTNSRVGIGTTAPTGVGANYKLLALDGTWGSNLRLGTVGSSQWDIWNNYTDFYIGPSASAKVTIRSGGNVGIGTTVPLAKLHVTGQCVTGDTLLLRKRKKKRRSSSWSDGEDGAIGSSDEKTDSIGRFGSLQNDEDDGYEDVRIDQIRAGDEVMTLDEETGEFVTSTVKQMMVMGNKKIFKLTTESGKEVKTTEKHPYLVRGEVDDSWVKVKELTVGHEIATLGLKNEFVDRPAYLFIDETGMGNDLNQPYFGVGGLAIKDTISLNIKLHNIFEKLLSAYGGKENGQEFKFSNITKDNKEFYHRVLDALFAAPDWEFNSLLIQKDEKGWTPFSYWRHYLGNIIELAKLFPTEKLNIVADYLSKPNVSVKKLTDILYTNNIENVLQLESQGSLLLQVADILLGAIAFKLREKIVKTTNTKEGKQEIADRIWERLTTNKKDGYKVTLYRLSAGVAPSLRRNRLTIPEDGSFVNWEKIKSIEELPEEMVYDLEIENTHNFVANGIVAHNTTTAIASVSGTSSFANLVVDQTGVGDIFTASVSGAPKFTILNSGDVNIVNLSTNGAVYSNNGTLTNVNPSSELYKSNIAETNLNAERLLGLKVKSFIWNSNGQEDFGFIAEDIKNLVPELYLEQNGVKGYRQDHVVFYLTQIMQDHEERIKNYELSIMQIPQIQNEIASLSAQMASVSARLAKVEETSSSWSEAIGSINISTMSAEFGSFSDSLKVVGTTQLANTTIGGNLTVGLIHIDDMKASISSLTGVVTVEGILKVTKGIVLSDTVTGEDYCVQMTNGEMVKKKGECE